MRIAAVVCVGVGTCVAVAACGEVSGPENDRTFVGLTSDTHDIVGEGGTYEYTQANADITVYVEGGVLQVQIESDHDWLGNFEMPNARDRLEVGDYPNMSWIPSSNTSGRMHWMQTSSSVGCASHGAFWIDRVVYAGDELTAVDLRFEQYCTQQPDVDPPAALRGVFRWRANDPTERISG